MGTLILLNLKEKDIVFNSSHFNLGISIQFNLHYENSFNIIFVQMKHNFHKINSFFFISFSLILWSSMKPIYVLRTNPKQIITSGGPFVPKYIRHLGRSPIPILFHLKSASLQNSYGIVLNYLFKIKKIRDKNQSIHNFCFMASINSN